VPPEVEVRFCDEEEWGFGWIAAEPKLLQRCSHALSADGKVWIFDPVDGEGVEERIRDLGEPAGVVQLLDRHARDCASLALGLGVPLHRIPLASVPGTSFRPVLIVRNRWWQEVAIWWPERQVLACADALGTVGYFTAPGERLGVHPLLRIAPPHRLGGLQPAHILCGHGEGVHEDAADALHEALATSSRRLPRVLVNAAAERLRRLRSG
jgi:hypothetical protein